MPPVQDWKSKRGQLAALTRHHPEADHSRLAADLRAERLRRYVVKVVTEAPPLTPEQRDRIASALWGAASRADDSTGVAA